MNSGSTLVLSLLKVSNEYIFLLLLIIKFFLDSVQDSVFFVLLVVLLDWLGVMSSITYNTYTDYSDIDLIFLDYMLSNVSDIIIFDII